MAWAASQRCAACGRPVHGSFARSTETPLTETGERCEVLDSRKGVWYADCYEASRTGLLAAGCWLLAVY